MIDIQEIAFVGYPVSDVPKARSFYEGILGLKPTMDHEIGGMPGVHWIEYEIAGGTFAISNAWPSSGQSGPLAAFEVGDFEASMKALREAGVKIEMEPIETPVCWMAAICDPDGNSITIHKRKPGHS